MAEIAIPCGKCGVIRMMLPAAKKMRVTDLCRKCWEEDVQERKKERIRKLEEWAENERERIRKEIGWYSL